METKERGVVPKPAEVTVQERGPSALAGPPQPVVPAMPGRPASAASRAGEDLLSKPTVRMNAVTIPLEAYRDDMLVPVTDDDDAGPVLRAKVERIADEPSAGSGGAPRSPDLEPVTARATEVTSAPSAAQLDPLELDPLDWSDG